MQAVVLSVHLILALALILVVLLQRSEGGGLGIGGGGVMTSRGAATALSKLTWGLGIAFMVTSLALTILSATGGRGGSVIDTAGAPLPATAPGVPTPGLEGDLLPKVPATSSTGEAAPTTPAPAPATSAPASPAPATGPAAPPPVK